MTENSISSKHTKIISGIKYVYLLAFFALLAGVFHPFITDSPKENIVYGISTLFFSMVGGILVYKGITSSEKQLTLTSIGLGIMIVSLFLISQIGNFPIFKT